MLLRAAFVHAVFRDLRLNRPHGPRCTRRGTVRPIRGSLLIRTLSFWRARGRQYWKTRLFTRIGTVCMHDTRYQNGRLARRTRSRGGQILFRTVLSTVPPCPVVVQTPVRNTTEWLEEISQTRKPRAAHRSPLTAHWLPRTAQPSHMFT